MERRHFIKGAILSAGGLLVPGLISCRQKKMHYKISLAQWSLHRTLYAGEMDHLDFAKVAKQEFGIDAVEYVNSFFFEKAQDKAYLKEMKIRSDDYGVLNLLIMCDNEGSIGDQDVNKREKAIENHYKWFEAAKYLGCHSIRVNAHLGSSFDKVSIGHIIDKDSYRDQIGFAADGLRKLTEYGDVLGVNTLVENHGGLSSHGKWLSSVMKEVDHPRCGTLPDFGNFRIEGETWYDRYEGVKDLMPFAKAVSAKSHDFNSEGNEINTDFFKMINIVLDANYKGYVGIEYEGSNMNEFDGIKATKYLLERVRDSI
ncbi:MAG: sugar phosphate isomerase/epimerase family protein [Candidatus Neomarinimicrobiota bacterium]